jgi:hypothetical protein
MTSSNTLKKLVSIGAAMLLAVGGSLVAAQPASATTPSTISNLVLLHTGQTNGQFQADLTAITGGSFAQGSAPTADAIWWIARPVASANLSSTDTTDVVDHSSPATGELNGSASTSTAPGGSSITGRLINVSGLTAGTAYMFYFVLRSTALDGTTKSYSSVAALPFTTDAAPPTLTIANGMLTGTVGTPFTMGSFTATGLSGTITYSYAVGVRPAGMTFDSTTGQFAGTPQTSLSRSMFIMTATGSISGTATTNIYMTISAAAGAGSSGGGSSSPVAESAKPLPVWAAPILKQIPTLSKTLNTDGGKVSLTDGDFSSLKSVTVGGQAVTFSTDAKGDVNIPIPAGKAGTTADLVVTFTGGKMTIQDGIKYVAPVDLNTVPEAPVAGFKGNSSKVSGAVAASILYAAQIDHKANAIACSGFAASQAQVALATARAQAACDYATSSYANLTKSTVTVVINKAKAKSAAVGIKVYH